MKIKLGTPVDIANRDLMHNRNIVRKLRKRLKDRTPLRAWIHCVENLHSSLGPALFNQLTRKLSIELDQITRLK